MKLMHTQCELLLLFWPSLMMKEDPPLFGMMPFSVSGLICYNVLNLGRVGGSVGILKKNWIHLHMK